MTTPRIIHNTSDGETATVLFYDVINDIEEIQVGTHKLEFGGVGDGYCYAHQSFDCLEHLTDEERKALHDV